MTDKLPYAAPGETRYRYLREALGLPRRLRGTMKYELTCHDCERRIEMDERPPDGELLCPTCRALLIAPADGAAADEEGAIYSTPAVNHCP